MSKTEEELEDPVLTLSKVSFSKLFFEALDEQTAEHFISTGECFPDWDRAVARAKLEGIVPLHGSGSRVMATIQTRGVTVEACYGDCLFRRQACGCNNLDHDVCLHPGAPDDLVLTDSPTPPVLCPMREATFHVALERKFCVDRDK